MIKWSIKEKNITVLNLHMSNITSSKYIKQKLRIIKQKLVYVLPMAACVLLQ